MDIVIKEMNSNVCFFFLEVLCIICGLALISVLKWLQILERPVVISYIDNLVHDTSNLSKYHKAQFFFPF